MKSKWTYLFLFCILLLSISKGQSQEASVRPERVKPMAALEYSMQIQTLNETQLTSFSQRALQKMEDILGYVRMMRDTSLDEGFRERAEQLAAQAFFTPLEFESFVKWLPSKIDSPQLLLETPFTLVSTFDRGVIYQGKIRLGNKENTSSRSYSAFILKQPKKFGKEINMVWDVKLGSK